MSSDELDPDVRDCVLAISTGRCGYSWRDADTMHACQRERDHHDPDHECTCGAHTQTAL